MACMQLLLVSLVIFAVTTNAMLTIAVRFSSDDDRLNLIRVIAILSLTQIGVLVALAMMWQALGVMLCGAT